MPTLEVKEKKVAAAQKRVDLLQDQLRKTNGKAADLADSLLKAEEHLRWVTGMPVDDGSEPNVRRLLDSPATTLEGDSSESRPA